ncbi:DUF7878 domain-containing protein [Cellulomonas composti]|nr:hypothetical protein [Cellulomonas composti]
MTYDRLDSSELRGTTQADYLIALDADLQVVAAHQALYEEPRFPVVELARSLRVWLADPSRGDFEFESMSFEEVGSIAFRQTRQGWVFGSIFASELPPMSLEWADVELCCRQLISRVEEDLAGLGINPGEVLRQ